MKRNLIFIIAISFVGMLAMSGCGCGISEPIGSLTGHGYVDLGLPSGTLWATCNIGADDPNDVGDYFAYGELWAKDKYFDSNYSYQFKSNILSPSDDAATIHWGEDWYMPTKEDFEELYSRCTWEWTSHYFKKGYKITGPNGNSIFLPTTGDGNGAKTLTKYGYYRTSSAIFINDDVLRGWTAFTFLFSEDSYRIEDVMPRPVDGVAIRPVSSGNGSHKTSLVKETKTKGSCNGHDWVDLGLPSGTKWATCNVGADNPEDYGNYYAWGETSTKTTYDNDKCRYMDYYNYKSNLTKYCSNSRFGYNGFTDNLTTLQSSDDAATANWGSAWCMPTREEFEELKNNCTVTRTTQNGINGCLFTGPNGNSIFLPAAGSRYDSDLGGAGYSGKYWSSSLSTNHNSEAISFYFYSDSDYCHVDIYSRGCGFTVRPVCQP